MSASSNRVRIPVFVLVPDSPTRMKTTPVADLLLLALTVAGMAGTVPNHATANLALGQQDFVSNSSAATLARVLRFSDAGTIASKPLEGKTSVPHVS